MKEKNYDLFKLILAAQVAYFMDKDKEEFGTDYWLPWFFRLNANAKVYSKMRKILPEDLKCLNQIDNDVVFLMNKEKEVSYIIFVLELMRLYAENFPEKYFHNFNISKKKLLFGFRHYTIAMLNAKLKDRELYDEKKKIMEDSKKVALNTYNTMQRVLLNGDYPARVSDSNS